MISIAVIVFDGSCRFSSELLLMRWCDLAHNSMQIRGLTGELLQHVRRVQQVHTLAEAICVLEVDSVPFDLCVTFNTEWQTGLLAAVVRVLRVVPVTRTAYRYHPQH